MAFKFITFAALLTYASAGIIGAPAPLATYSAAPAVSSSYFQQASAPIAVAHAAPVVSSYSAPVAIHAPAIGASHQSVERSLGGAQSVSHYSKAVDSAFSSVRKYDTRFTNDALHVAHAPVVSTYAAHAPVVSTYAANAPIVSSYTAHAPFVSSYAAHSPVFSTYAAPGQVVSGYAAHAPLTYSAGPVVTKTAAVAYSPATVVSHATFSGLGASYAW